MAEPRQRSLHMRLLPLAVALALSAACSKAPTTEELLAQAKQYQADGKNPAAIIQLRNLLDKNPKHAEARYTLGMIYRQMNAPHSAEKEFRMALAAGIYRPRQLTHQPPRSPPTSSSNRYRANSHKLTCIKSIFSQRVTMKL